MDQKEYNRALRELEPLFVEKSFSIKDTGLTYRTISSWSQEGLIDHFQNSDGKWHKFSFTELIEILIYKELREFGFSLDKIKKVKESITNTGKTSSCLYKGVPDTILNWRLLNVLIQGVNIFLVIDKNIESGLHSATDFELADAILEGSLDPDDFYCEHAGLFVISLRRILNIAKVQYKKRDSNYDKLFKSILEVEDGKTIEFSVDGEEFDIKDLKQTDYLNYDPKKKSLIDLIQGKKNQKITISTNSDGKITSIKRDQKIK